MVNRKVRILLSILFLLVVLSGPYIYVFGITSSRVFPHVEELDRGAMDGLIITVDLQTRALTVQPRAQLVDGQLMMTWVEALYSVKFSVLNRIFKTYITFPALLGVRDLSFEATGIFNSTIIMTCNRFVGQLIAPTGFEVLAVYGSILRAGNNTTTTAFCSGPGPSTVDWTSLSRKYGPVVPMTLSWVVSATLQGEKLQESRSWSGVQREELVLP